MLLPFDLLVYSQSLRWLLLLLLLLQRVMKKPSQFNINPGRAAPSIDRPTKVVVTTRKAEAALLSRYYGPASRFFQRWTPPSTQACSVRAKERERFSFSGRKAGSRAKGANTLLMMPFSYRWSRPWMHLGLAFDSIEWRVGSRSVTTHWWGWVALAASATPPSVVPCRRRERRRPSLAAFSSSSTLRCAGRGPPPDPCIGPKVGFAEGIGCRCASSGSWMEKARPAGLL